MKIAILHDYLNEFGGAESVLKTLSDMWPDAPIYTAFCVPGSTACNVFSNRKVITSWMQNVPYYQKLFSPLRFLIPQIWGSFDLSGYDLIITSASWYVTKGLGKRFGVPEICYCHTPPRWLYGYQTSVDLQKYLPVRIYAAVVGHFLRMYDWEQAQKVDQFVANSENVAKRIKKFYRKDSVVIYPPISIKPGSFAAAQDDKEYYLMITRLVGGKGIELAVEAAKKYGIKLKIAGEQAGWAGVSNENSENVQFLGRVSDEEKYRLMGGAKAFLALANNEDFGITPVESMACGTPVIAYNGGGYRETVVDGKTGVLFDELTPEGLWNAIQKCEKIRFNVTNIKTHARKFSTDNFKKQMLQLVNDTIVQQRPSSNSPKKSKDKSND